ncbi:RNA-directed DNA polymerase, eukaryota [Tanacetum coccineum]
MSSSSKSPCDYSLKYQRAILEPWRQGHNLPTLPPYPPPNRTPPTSPITTNYLSSPSPLQNPTQNQIVHDLNELHHLSNLLDINLQQAIEATNPSPPTSPCILLPTLDQENFHSGLCHCCLQTRDLFDILRDDLNLEDDFFKAINHFHSTKKIPLGCNSSFFTLIPNVVDPMFIKDYRPISLIGSFYKIVGKLLANRIASVVEDLISTEQSAFVKGRRIMDGLMILNEILNWCKKEKKTTLVFKIGFEKAYESIRWDYLQDVMIKMRFGRKWCAWIRGSVKSSMTSILVNESPTDEFRIRKGLRQRDPLYLFLLILAIEGLHMLISRAIHSSQLHGLQIGNRDVRISHLFYGDDAIFLGDLNVTNVLNIVLMLQCFYHAVENVHLDVFLKRKVEDGIGTRLWDDYLISGGLLKDLYPHVYNLDNEPEFVVANKLDLSLNAPFFAKEPERGS